MERRAASLMQAIPPELLSGAQQISRAPGAYITRAAVPVEQFYILRSGCAKLIYDSPNADPLIIDLYHQGDFFGEMEMAGLSYLDRSIVAMTDCALYQFTREQFFQLWNTCGAFSLYVLRVHCDRLLRAGDDKINAERLVLREKVFRIIQQNLNERGYFLYTKDILAEMAGISIRSLNRTLALLEGDQLIRLSKGTIRLNL